VLSFGKYKANAFGGNRLYARMLGSVDSTS
jgi:hypothetical protein